MFDQLKRFLLDHFPVMGVEEDGSIVALYLVRDDESADLWMGPDGYLLDFGSATPQFFLSEGWSGPERWGHLTVAWSDAKESTLWFYLPKASNMKMDLRLLPFTFPSAPRQKVKVFVNGRYLEEVQLEEGWRVYTLRLPVSSLSQGINAVRFVYRYAVSPSKVLPQSEDPRTLAVAFDFIAFRPE